MKINYLTLVIGIFFLIILGCAEDEVSLNEKEILLSNTWIKDSYYIENLSDNYEEFFYKDEYVFYDNGKCKIKGLRTSYNDQNELVQDIYEYESDWLFDEDAQIIDFKENDASEFVGQHDWKILEVSNDTIIVKQIKQSDLSVDSRILLKNKN